MVKRKRANGYTLAEAVLVAAIVGLISSISGGMLVQVNRYWSLSRARLDLQREARAAMYIVSRELRQAKNVTIIIDRLNATQPFCSRITFTRQEGNTVVFYQNGSQLISQIGNNQSILSRHLEYMAFTFPRTDDQTIVSVAMTVQETIYQGQVKALHMASQKVQVMN